MSVIYRNIKAPLFIKIEKNILADVRTILQKEHLTFNKPLIISSQNVMNSGGKEIMQGFTQEAIYLTDGNTIEEANNIALSIKQNHNDLIIALGGGRILDLGKYAATQTDINYISIPTSPSHDGLASPIAVLTDANNKKISLSVNMPMGILVDLTLVKKAPLKNIQAGTGDLISNFSAIYDWQLANSEKNEAIDDFAVSLAYSAADLIYGNVGQEKIDLTSETFLKTLINGLILSGIAMNIAGSSRPCSGAEHKISHAIDELYPNTNLHGIQVAYATLLTEKLRGHDYSLYIKLFKNIGLPVHYTDLGLTSEQISKAIELAATSRAERFTILEKQKINTNQIKDLINDL